MNTEAETVTPLSALAAAALLSLLWIWTRSRALDNASAVAAVALLCAAMSSSNADLTVSLEPHLLDVLRRVHPIVPGTLQERLSSELPRSEIHYVLLSDVSKWSRSDAGLEALKAKDIDPASYSMISLLAGTVTSPSKKLPPYVPPASAEDIALRNWNDKKAIAAVLNGLLSVGCSGGAAWWAADRSGWRDEWVRIVAFIRMSAGGVLTLL